MKKTITKTKIKTGTMVAIAIAVISVGGIMAAIGVTKLNGKKCSNLWWYDSQSTQCQQKKFCGLSMYHGLMTFKNKKDCGVSLRNKCGLCKQIASPPAYWCKNGQIVSGGKDSCGCEKAPKCIVATTTNSGSGQSSNSTTTTTTTTTTYSCTGTIPAGSTKCDGDDTGLSSNLGWSIAGISSMGCTARKCEYYNPNPAPRTYLATCESNNDCNSGYCYMLDAPPSPPGALQPPKGRCYNH